MEARRFGFDLSMPAAFKFDPTDADLVAHYLLPRALGLQSKYEHAIIDDDPASCPPWELMRRHGHAGSDQAFFFAPPRDPTKKERANRVVPPGNGGGVGGTWRGQKGQEEELFLFRGDGGAGGEIVVKFKKYNLTYYNDGEEKKSSGWVMNEYQIVEPPLLPGDVLARVKITDRANKVRRKKQQKTAQKSAVTSYHGEPSPSGSSYYHAHGQQVAGNAFSMTTVSAGTSGSAQVVVAVHQEDCDGADMGVPVVNCDTKFLHSGEGTGCYVEDNNKYYMESMNNHFNQPCGADNVTYGGSSNSYSCHNDGGDMKHETDDGFCG